MSFSYLPSLYRLFFGAGVPAFFICVYNINTGFFIYTIIIKGVNYVD